MAYHETDLKSFVVDFSHHKRGLLCTDSISIRFKYNQRLGGSNIAVRESLAGVIDYSMNKIIEYYSDHQFNSSATFKISYFCSYGNTPLKSFQFDTDIDIDVMALEAAETILKLTRTEEKSDKEIRDLLFPGTFLFTVTKFI